MTFGPDEPRPPEDGDRDVHGDLTIPPAADTLPSYGHPADDLFRGDRAYEALQPGAVFLARFRLRPWITYVLLALIAAAGVAVEVDLRRFHNPDSLIEFGAKDRLLIEGGDTWRLLTAAFLHRGVIHLLVDGYALWVLGKFCEVLFGGSRFLLIYAGSALGGSLLSFWLTDAVSVGASGAIFGLLGAALVFGFRHRAGIPAPIGRRMRGMLVFWLLVNLFLSVRVPVIDLWGHVGGLVAGTVLALLLGDATFARRGPALAYRLGAAAAGVLIFASLGLGVRNRLTVAYPTLTEWAAASQSLEIGDAEAALAGLERARAGIRGREPWLPLIYLDRARALRLDGDEAAAAAAIDSAAATPLGRLRFPWALEAAERFFGFERYGEAETLYRRVLAGRREPNAANSLAWMYLTARDPAFQRPAEALPIAEKAVAGEPENPFYLGTLGTAQLQLGRYSAALENLRKAVDLHDPGNEGSDLYLLAITLARLGMAEEARAVLDEALDRFPDDAFRRQAEKAVENPAVGS